MAQADIERGIARLFLAPQHILNTLVMLEKRHGEAVDAKDYEGALYAAQLLIAVQKLSDRQDREADREADKPAAKGNDRKGETK